MKTQKSAQFVKEFGRFSTIENGKTSPSSADQPSAITRICDSASPGYHGFALVGEANINR